MKQRFQSFLADYDFAQEHKQFLHSTKELPRTFSEINELCFPLFLTARQFFLMVDRSLKDGQEFFKENDTIISSEQPMSSKLETGKELITARRSEETKKGSHERVEVTASKFRAEMWPKIKPHCTRDKLDPLLVWMEIQSFIKGSLQALKTTEGALSEKEDLGARRASNFPMKRPEVHKLFKEYIVQLKHRDRQIERFDNGDFIYKLYTRLKKQPLQSRVSLQRIYVDEVQDFTQAELAVIIQCCKDPNGFFFAGDTAQTIIGGIAFRFEDLCSIFYEMQAVIPEVNMLTINHRSHQGITKLASTVTDLLKCHFKDSFDWKNIPADSSKVVGPSPLFLCCDDLTIESFHQLEDEESGTIEFGANQVVIIRDEEALKTLPKVLEDAILLTVPQCKGLEFNDVLLYNFFTDFSKQFTTDKKARQGGGVQEIWRISADYLKENPDKVLRSSTSKVHPLKFDEGKHKTLCAELKCLYTVTTRARQHLWVFEDLSPNELPMLDYWYRRGVIEEDYSGEHITKQLREVSEIKSTREEWRHKGHQLREKRLWREAIKCYRKSGEHQLVEEMKLEMLQEEAEATPKEGAFYESIQRKAFRICMKLDEMEHDLRHLKSAAFCLREAKMYKLSATLFEKLHEYDEALEIYKKTGDLDYVRLQEQLECFKEALTFACKYSPKDYGLKVARKYREQGKLQLSELSKTADNTIIKFALREDSQHADIEQPADIKDAVIEWLEFKPDTKPDEYILSKKSVALKSDKNKAIAFGLLCCLKRHDEALYFARGHRMFSKGNKLAKHLERKDSVVTLQIEQATLELMSSKTIESKHVVVLQELATEQTSKPHIAAKANLLLAKYYTGKKAKDVQAMQKYAEKALELYTSEQQGNTVGETECLLLLGDLEKIKSLYERVKETKEVCVKELSTLVENTLKNISKAKKLLNKTTFGSAELAVYGLELQEEKTQVYITPSAKKQSLWLKALSTSTPDEYGMIKLNQKEADNTVREYVQDHVKSWIENCVKSANKMLYSIFDSYFRFHSETKRNGYLPIEQLQEETHDMSLYITLCELEQQLYAEWRLKREYARVNEDPTNILLRLLSPFSQLTVHFTHEQFEMIGNSAVLLEALKRKVESRSRVPFRDRLLDAWQISALPTSQQSWPWYEQQVADNHHWFSTWLQACKQLKHGSNALGAIEISLDVFNLQTRGSNNDYLSVENLCGNHINTHYSTVNHAFSLLPQTEPEESNTYTKHI